MSIALYDISIANYLQLLNSMDKILEKGAAYCEENGLSTDELINMQLHPDMAPLRFQLNSVAHHSLGAIKGLQAGEFGPPPNMPDQSYEVMHQLIIDAKKELESISESTVNELEGGDMKFKMGSFEIPFTAEGFILSFSLPNFYFHATTAYDILRQKGVKLGKMDYLGQPRVAS